MSGTGPPFDRVVPPDDPDRARLEQVHALLLEAGAPPELPPALAAAPPEPRATVLAFPRRRRYTAIAAVVAAATILVGIGYVLGAGGGSEAPVQRITMSGAGGAAASIALLARDEAGNWPMTLEVTGLAPLPRGETYTLWLTRGDELAESCGTFAVASGTTTVPLNAPYQLKKFDGWVVVRSGTERPFLLSTETS